MMHKRTRNTNRGFTLIEVMIVIAIIGILAAIAVGRFVNYRARSYNTQALSDTRTVKLELGSYYAEWSNFPY